MASNEIRERIQEYLAEVQKYNAQNGEEENND